MLPGALAATLAVAGTTTGLLVRARWLGALRAGVPRPSGRQGPARAVGRPPAAHPPHAEGTGGARHTGALPGGLRWGRDRDRW